MAESTTPPVRIIIADDHALFRQGLMSLLHLEADIQVTAEVERVDDIVPALTQSPCDILLLDFQMDRHTLGDIEGLARQVHVAVITGTEDPEQALAAFRAGAHAVVFKRFAVDTVLEAIRAVARGEVWVPRTLQAYMVNGMRGSAPVALTARERDVIRHVALGLRNAEVAQRLLISEPTVKAHLNSIFRKVGVRDRVELTLYAARSGIIEIHEQQRN